MSSYQDHPAFPVAPHPGDDVNRQVVKPNTGMSLLDYFAGQALLHTAKVGMDSKHYAAKCAYDYAEAMMAEREKRKPK